MKHRITAHISPYLGGLAPETHNFVAELNKEAIRHKLPVRFTATANRILATGDLKRAANSATLGGWTLRRAIKNGYIDHERRRVWLKRAIRRQTDSEMEGEKPVLKQGNSQHRGKLRRYEKNRRVGAETLAPWLDRWRDRYLRIGLSPSGELAELGQLVRLARSGEELLTPQEVLEGKVAVAAGTLYHLIRAIPQSGRDGEEIYPGDFRTARIPQPLRTNWAADKLEWWRALGWGRYTARKTFGLEDYSQPVKLNGRTELRQKAAIQNKQSLADYLKYGHRERPAEPRRRARDYGLDPHWDIIWRDCESRLSLYALGGLKTPDEQRLLLRIGRFYKSSCWYSRKEPRSLFDKCAASSSKAASWARHRVQFDPADADLIAKREIERVRRTGGRVIYLIPGTPYRQVAAKRYAQLAATQESDNKKWVSYLNSTGISRRMREWGPERRGSLNIELETIETPPVMRQTTEADTCQPFTKSLITTRPAERPSSPLRAESPKRRRTSSELT
jgi:hypothetical protein